MWLSLVGVLLISSRVVLSEEPSKDRPEAAVLPKDWKISIPVAGFAGLTHRRGDYLLAHDQIWRIRNPKRQWTLPVQPTKGLEGQPIAISEDGKLAIIQERDTATVSLFSQTGRKTVLEKDAPLICAAFLPSDLGVIVTEKDLDTATIKLFEIGTQKVVGKFDLPHGLFFTVEVHPSGRSIALVSSKDDDDPHTSITVYDLQNGKQTFKHVVERKNLGRSARAHLAFSGDGTRLACAMGLSGIRKEGEFLLVCMGPGSKETPHEATLPIDGVALPKPLQYVRPGVWLLNYGDQIGTYDEAKKSYAAISKHNRMYSMERILVINSTQAVVELTSLSDFTKKLVVSDIERLGQQ